MENESKYAERRSAERNWRYVIDSVIVGLIVALIVALANGYVLIQQENTKINDIDANIVQIQKMQQHILDYIVEKK